MRTSEALNELAAALSKAQGEANFQEEARILNRYSRTTRGIFRQRGVHARPLNERFFEKLIFGMSNCWYWAGHVDGIGYGRFAALGENKAHRVSYRMFHGDIPEGMKVLHRCDVMACVNPDHLFLGTQMDNVADMIAKGRQRFAMPKHGVDNPRSKLTPHEVRAMRELYAEGNHSYKLIGRIFGIATMNAYRVINRQLWKTVE